MLEFNSNFEEFLFNKLDHLRECYSSDEEFLEHIRSGEVTIPIATVLKYQNEFDLLNMI